MTELAREPASQDSPDLNPPVAAADPAANRTPPATTATAAQRRTAGTPALMQLALVFAIGLGGFAVYRTYTVPVPPPVYTLNVDALMSAKEIQTESLADPAAIAQAMQGFVTGLHDDLVGLSRRGAIVLKSGDVLTDTPSVDLTAGLAKRLGLEVALAQVPAREAARRALYQQRLKAQVLGATTAPDAASSAAAPASGTASSAASPASAASGDGLAHLD